MEKTYFRKILKNLILKIKNMYIDKFNAISNLFYIIIKKKKDKKLIFKFLFNLN